MYRYIACCLRIQDDSTSHEHEDKAQVIVSEYFGTLTLLCSAVHAKMILLFDTVGLKMFCFFQENYIGRMCNAEVISVPI